MRCAPAVGDDMASYLDLATFKGLTIMPATDVDGVETISPGWIDRQLEVWSAWLDSRLRKRYLAPFQVPYPIAVTGWLERIVTQRVYLRRGYDPNDPQAETIKGYADTAVAEVLEAADSEKGLFDLPLREDTTVTGLAEPVTRGYSERSPYVGFDVQAQAGRQEDRNGRGSGG